MSERRIKIIKKMASGKRKSMVVPEGGAERGRVELQLQDSL